ncbi:hypothetical protein PG997_012665 [Apiospora hydei]|uniref:Uncharacterized protein n=1 Tax=Apiospora hydei TaxID=1337664 RepID=A0ABR1V425_9PEZI
MSESDLGKSKHGIPDVVMQHIDKYVDGLAPQIQPLISTELDVFQQKTVDSLEDKVIEAFRSLFDKSGEKHSDSRSLDGAPPDSYGIGSLPFANEIQSLTRSFSQITNDAQGDLQQILNLTEGGSNEPTRSRGGGHDDSFSEGARGFLSAAIGAVSEHARRESGGQPVALDGFLGVLSNAVKDSSRNPEEKARMISPEIKEKVSAILRQQHAPIAEQFTRIALDHIKKWLRGNTSSRDLGDGAKDEIKSLVKGVAGLFGHKKQSDDTSRDLPRDGEDSGGSGGGFSKMISDKLSTGIAQVHREVRLEFRKILGTIEKSLFEALPDQFQGPLEKILGGNPFDSSLDSQANASRGVGDRGLGDDIKTKLVESIRRLVRKVQETLREKILDIVNGGHRKFERSSWVFVQNKVEEKVQRFLPDVRITVPDDIGNEGVSVGAPDKGKLNNPPHEGGMPPAPSQGQPPPSHDYQPPQHDYKPPQHDYRPPQHDYQPPGQGYQPSNPPPTHDYRPQGSGGGYQPGQGQYTSGPQEHQYPPPPSQHNTYGSGPPSQSYPPPPPSYTPPPQSYPLKSYNQQQPPYDRR